MVESSIENSIKARETVSPETATKVKEMVSPETATKAREMVSPETATKVKEMVSPETATKASKMVSPETATKAIREGASPSDWEKQEQLKQYLKGLRRVAVAFSSGVDSAYLLKVAQEVLGENVLAVTAAADSFPKRELDEAEAFCRQYGIQHVVVHFDILQVEGFCQNPINRCYLCKRALLSQIQEAARKRQADIVLEGSNMDDDGDFRPGRQAVRELGVKSPLREVGLTKAQIRILSREIGLAAWDKPSFACLASRFPYGEEISREKLAMVGKAEQFLTGLGFRQVRVRMHGDIARIELPEEDFSKIMQTEVRNQVSVALQSYGFAYTALDLEGYRTGSLNRSVTV